MYTIAKKMLVRCFKVERYKEDSANSTKITLLMTDYNLLVKSARWEKARSI